MHILQGDCIHLLTKIQSIFLCGRVSLVRPCDRQPCKNNGECSDDGVKCFKCECPAGFKGFDCSKKGNYFQYDMQFI